MDKRIQLTLLALLLGAAACAAVQPVSPNGPRRNEPSYPFLIIESQQRRDEAATVLAQLAQQPNSANNPAATLQPITATIRKLPDDIKAPLYIPRIGTGTLMSEEETRESLRRFLSQWQKLLGANPAQLSLAQQAKEPDGTNLAVYEQRPFSYPLRGDYGRIEIRFADDRRIIRLSSTAIPDADKIQAGLMASAPRLKSDDVPKHLPGRQISFTDLNGVQRNYTIGSERQINSQQVVIYPLLSATEGILEFHLAWEVSLSDAPVKTIYYDSIKDQILAAS